jgi:predicted amino acid-binding ACT domain protein
VDLISTSEVHISMALNPAVTPGQLEACLTELAKYGQCSVLSDMAILSLVGKDLRNKIGISARMFGVLADVGSNIEMISQGASEINISCVIEEAGASRALVAVHDALVIGAGAQPSTSGVANSASSGHLKAGMSSLSRSPNRSFSITPPNPTAQTLPIAIPQLNGIARLDLN